MDSSVVDRLPTNPHRLGYAQQQRNDTIYFIPVCVALRAVTLRVFDWLHRHKKMGSR